MPFRYDRSAYVPHVQRVLCQDSRRTVQATVFDISDGVRTQASSGYYNPQVTKSLDGKLWFLCWDGVSVINPRHIPFNNLVPPVYVEQIVADRKKYVAMQEANANIRLPPHIRDLAIDYTALSFVAPEKVRFRYMLEGRDISWQEPGTRRQAFYNDLGPGKY
jgi:hypothetical protein